MSAIPLAGIRVLEFSHTVMGPTAGLLFAELGADVIKVEPAPQGDHTRRLGGFAAGFFAAFSRNKRSLAVDLKQAEGQAVIHRPSQPSIWCWRIMRPARWSAWAAATTDSRR
jgi:crotonobetainyl-CoA:carnitine CoA-transferase CaiB-like acyl-CoA transferase